jgi:solute carrier family 15 oligopeptide transporter 1
LDGGKSLEITSTLTTSDSMHETLKEVGKYKITVDIDNGGFVVNRELTTEFKVGGNYQVLVQYDPDIPNLQELVVQTITSANEIHIFWLLPQFVIMTAGEIMFSITSLQFSFTQVQKSEFVVVYLWFICNVVY